MKCPSCGNKIKLKLYGHNRKYQCGTCSANLIEDPRRNIILYILMAFNIGFLPSVSIFYFNMDRIYAILIACTLTLLIINYVPKLILEHN